MNKQSKASPKPYLKYYNWLREQMEKIEKQSDLGKEGDEKCTCDRGKGHAGCVVHKQPTPPKISEDEIDKLAIEIRRIGPSPTQIARHCLQQIAQLKSDLQTEEQNRIKLQEINLQLKAENERLEQELYNENISHGGTEELLKLNANDVKALLLSLAQKDEALRITYADWHFISENWLRSNSANIVADTVVKNRLIIGKVLSAPIPDTAILKQFEDMKQLLTIIGEQLECPSRNTTMTSYRRDGSVIISNDIRQKVKDILKPTKEGKK